MASAVRLLILRKLDEVRPGRLLGNRSRHAVFLCYHSIAAMGPPFLSLPPETFERQLAALRRRGFAGGDLAALRGIAEGRRPSRPLAFLTFDDGYVDNHEAALPLLADYGFPALLFALPPYVDRAAPFDWPEVVESRRAHPDVMRSMSWPMVEAMAEAGVEVGSHTCSHPHLTRLEDEALREELLSSRERVRERLGRCDVVAYPFGEWDARVATAAGDAGYSFAMSLPFDGQRGATPLSVPRINVDARDRDRRFAVKLSPLGRRAFLSTAAGRIRVLRRARRARAQRHAVSEPD